MTFEQLLALLQRHANDYPSGMPVCVIQYDEETRDEFDSQIDSLHIVLNADGSVRRFALMLEPM